MYKLYLVENTGFTTYGDFVSMVIKANSLNKAYEIVDNYLLKNYDNMRVKITELTQNKIKNSGDIICENWNSE